MNYNTYIIAEIGINHEGKLQKCLDMIKNAKKSGVNAVKLQTIEPELNYSKNTLSYKLFKDAYLNKEKTEKAFLYAKKIGLDIFTTVGDIQTASWVNKLNPVAWKISSSMLTHLPLIKYISKFGNHIYISTGLAIEKEINQTVNLLKKNNTNFSLLHCTSIYPSELSSLNLHKIQKYRNKYNVKVGYSDHSLGDYASCLAVASGAQIIEKHFTFDNKRSSFDHKISLDYEQMKRFVSKIRQVEKIFLDNNDETNKIIRKNRKKFLRVLVAKKNIKKGTILDESHIAIKRIVDNTGGLYPEYYEKLLNKNLNKNLKKDDLILKEYIK